MPRGARFGDGRVRRTCRLGRNRRYNRKKKVSIKFAIGSSGRKKIVGPFGQALRLSDAVGTFAIVMVLPEDINLTSGSPRHHRSFLDIYLSQFSQVYLSDLLEYQRVLKQRNTLLKKIKSGKCAERAGHLDAWDKSLLGPALRIMEARRGFLREVSPRVRDLAAKLSSGVEAVKVGYLPSLKLGETSDMKEALCVLRKERERDLKLGVTVLGPHRDLIEITLGSEPLRNFGSLGQKKCVMIALKLAAFEILTEKRGEPAILILDEAFAALDKARSRSLLELLSGFGQVFLASASGDDFSVPDGGRSFDISSGNIKQK